MPFAVENVAALFDWPDDELTEGEFLAEIVERTGALLVLDIANVYANALNRGRDPWAELSRLPLERIAYCHIAGGSISDGKYHDTHTDPVPEAVLELLAQFTAAGHHPPSCSSATETIRRHWNCSTSSMPSPTQLVWIASPRAPIGHAHEHAR